MTAPTLPHASAEPYTDEEIDALETDMADFRGSPAIEEKMRLIATVRAIKDASQQWAFMLHDSGIKVLRHKHAVAARLREVEAERDALAAEVEGLRQNNRPTRIFPPKINTPPMSEEEKRDLAKALSRCLPHMQLMPCIKCETKR